MSFEDWMQVSDKINQAVNNTPKSAQEALELYGDLKFIKNNVYLSSDGRKLLRIGIHKIEEFLRGISPKDYELLIEKKH